MHQGGGDVEPTAGTARVALHRPVGNLGESEAVQQPVDAVGEFATGHMGQPPDEPEVLPAGQVVVDRGVLAGEADPVADLRGLAHGVEAEHLGPSGVRRAVGGQDAHGGRLARAVAAEQGEYLSPFHLEGDVIECGHFAEALAHVLDENCGCSHGGILAVRSLYGDDGRPAVGGRLVHAGVRPRRAAGAGPTRFPTTSRC